MFPEPSAGQRVAGTRGPPEHPRPAVGSGGHPTTSERWPPSPPLAPGALWGEKRLPQWTWNPRGRLEAGAWWGASLAVGKMAGDFLCAAKFNTQQSCKAAAMAPSLGRTWRWGVSPSPVP